MLGEVNETPQAVPSVDRIEENFGQKPARFLTDPAHQAIGIVGVQLVDEQGHVTRSSTRRPAAAALIGQALGLDRLMPTVFPPLLMLDWPHDETRTVDQVMGAFVFVRRPLFEALGGFDERFFVYFEDLDLAVRAKNRGFETVYLASTRIVHRGAGTTDAIKGQRLFHLGRSRILYALKHYSRIGALGVIAATLLIEPIVRITYSFISTRAGTAREIARGFRLLWCDVRNIMRTHARFNGA